MSRISLFLLCSALPGLAGALDLPTSGNLLGAGDVPVDSRSLPVRFRLTTGSTSSTVAWESSVCALDVRQGRYAVVLGSGCGPSIPDTAFPTNEQRFLEIEVQGVVLSPRLPIAPVPLSGRSVDTQALIQRLGSAGSVNDASNPVDWTQLKNIPTDVVSGGNYQAGAGLQLTGKTFALAPNAVTASNLASNFTLSSASVTGLGALASKSAVSATDLEAGFTLPATSVTGLGALASKSAVSATDLAPGFTLPATSVTGLGALASKSAVSATDLAPGFTLPGAQVTPAFSGSASVSGSLTVGSGIKLGNDSATCTAANAGTLRWTGAQLEVCMGSSGWATIQTSITYASCKALKTAQPAAADGVYSVDPDGAGGEAPVQAYCDMTTDGGGWTLLTKFSQHTATGTMSLAYYQQYFWDAQWIDGNAEKVPTSPSPQYDTFHVESHKWSRFLTNGQTYSLRQHFFKGTGQQVFDAAYSFTHGGYTDQNAAPEAARAWVLTNRRVFQDSTGIVWNTPAETVRFWLPFKSTSVSGNLYSGCAGYYFEPTGCGRNDTASRRNGNAGIIGGSGDGNDPASSWAPHMNSGNNYDVVYVHQASNVYGGSGAQMVLMYWIK